MTRRWKGDVIVVSNPRFETGSIEHEKYKEKQKQYYRNTADVQRRRARERVAKRRMRNQQFIVNFMADKHCCICGEEDRRVLAFDHLPGYDKFSNVADLVSKGASLEKLKVEITKCRILCHNCHMLETFKSVGGTYHDKLKPITDDEFERLYGDMGY